MSLSAPHQEGARTATAQGGPARPGLWQRYTPAWRHRTAVACLFLIVFWAYRPALRHMPRQDQWCFLLDTVQEDRFWPLLRQTYSYNRTREIAPGDYPLFRPVLFALLCAEKALFGHRYVYWQGVGIALHCAVVWVFVRILLRLHALCPAGPPAARRLRMALAYALALFFGVNFAGTEMVIWCHIHGYLLFTLLVLGGWLLLLDELCGERPAGGPSWRLGGAFLLTLLAAFTYEAGSLYAVVLGALLARARVARRQALSGLVAFGLFASVLLAYRAADWLDRRSHPNTQPDVTLSTVLEGARWGPTVDHARRYVLFTLCQPFFPSCPDWRCQGRLCIPEPGATPEAYRRPGAFLFVSYAAVLAGAALALWQLGRAFAGGRPLSALSFLLLPGGLIALHLGLVVFGRMNLRPGPLVLARNSYYAYTPLLALLVGLFYLWGRVPVPPGRGASVALALILGALGILSWSSARKVHAMTTWVRAAHRPLRIQVQCLQQLIDRHRHDEHFAVSFDPELFYSLEHFHGVSLPEILFCRYFDHEHPTHVVCLKEGKWCVLSAGDYHARHGERHRRLPRFVRAGEDYVLFRHQGRYYGMYQWDGRFRPGRDDYHYLLEGASIEEVRRQVPAALRRLDADRRAGRRAPRAPAPCRKTP